MLAKKQEITTWHCRVRPPTLRLFPETWQVRAAIKSGAHARSATPSTL